MKLMPPPLHILHLEDDPNDAELVQNALEADGVSCITTCVQTQDAFMAALQKGNVDLVLSDYALPKFDGLSAITTVRDNWPHVPVILVSGTLGEEQAIDSMKSGATDYVLKQRLSRLAPAIQRAMLEVEARAERVRLQAQFIASQKMEVIGQLAAGVAHDFNNILAVIMGYSGLIMASVPAVSPLRKFADEIRHASERAAGLTRQLLVFSRKQAVQPVVLDLQVVVTDLDIMLQRLIDENIELKIIPGIKLGHVKADPGYMGQVLMNLVVNARDAMPNGGQLTVTTENVIVKESDEGTRRGIVPGRYVMMSVSDTGTGMSKEVQSHMFEAFFTTKPRGKGTGLGLASCHTIVQQSGGHFEVLSEEGRGTTIKVFLPEVKGALHVFVRPDLSGALPRGTETLLVVEDEPSVRHLARGVLEAQGYTVLCASNGEDGLRVVREHKGPQIPLVVTDVIMPLMNGKVMADWLKATYPGIKILFTSGYTDEAIQQHGVLEEGVAFMPKPYSPATLAGKVREMLDS